jgi:hypothetical protein
MDKLQHFKRYNMLYHVSVPNKTREITNNLDMLLTHIFSENTPRITRFLKSGTTKFVYDTENSFKIFKIIVFNKNKLSRFIKEPLFMMEHPDICNVPQQLEIYGNIHMDSTEHFRIHNIDNIGDYCLMTWYENKARTTGDELKDDKNLNTKLQEFKQNSIPYLTSQNFTDLGDNNIGLFYDGKNYYFRWIDIQPVLESEPSQINSSQSSYETISSSRGRTSRRKSRRRKSIRRRTSILKTPKRKLIKKKPL